MRGLRFLVIGLLAACASLPTVLDKPDVQVDAIHLDSIDSHDLNFRVNLKVHNPNTLSITVKSVDATLSIEGKPLATGHSTESHLLTGHADTVVALKIHANMDTLGNTFRTLLFNPGKTLHYRLEGELVLTQLELSRHFERQGEESLLSWIGHQTPSSSQSH